MTSIHTFDLAKRMPLPSLTQVFPGLNICYLCAMEMIEHEINQFRLVELRAKGILIANVADGTDLVGNAYYRGFDKVILHLQNIDGAFFDLKTGIAGEILQKFSNYRLGLAIIGDFSKFESKSFRDFMLESNKLGHVNFVGTIAEALDTLSC
ncbi:MAG: DUF4180 domain-containing protein [Pedobacter sp.]